MEEKMRKQKEKGRSAGEKPESEENEKQEESEEQLNEKSPEVNRLEDSENIKPYSQVAYESTTQAVTPLPTISSNLLSEPSNIALIPAKLPPIPRTEVESERLEVIEIKTDGNSGHLSPLSEHYNSQ